MSACCGAQLPSQARLGMAAVVGAASVKHQLRSAAINHSWAFTKPKAPAKVWRGALRISDERVSSQEQISTSSRQQAMEVATNRQAASESSVGSGSPCMQVLAAHCIVCSKLNARGLQAGRPLQPSIALCRLATDSKEVTRECGFALREVTSLCSSEPAAAWDIKPSFFKLHAAHIP